MVFYMGVIQDVGVYVDQVVIIDGVGVDDVVMVDGYVFVDQGWVVGFVVGVVVVDVDDGVILYVGVCVDVYVIDIIVDDCVWLY